MPASVTVNNMTVVHKSSMGIHQSFPDVCKTPMAPSPVPIPYPNIAMSSNSAETASTVKADGNPIMVKDSVYSMSTGDEAGSLLGVVSNKIKGTANPAMFSMDVKAEGKNVFRQLDIMLSNGNHKPTNPPPGPNGQPPKPAHAQGQDPKQYKIKEVKWSTDTCKCGDPVEITTTTENFENGTIVPHTITRQPAPGKKKKKKKKKAKSEAEIVDNTEGKTKGEKVEIKWLTRNGPWRKVTTMLNAKATGKGGPRSTGKQLKLEIPAEKDGTLSKSPNVAQGVTGIALPIIGRAIFVKPRTDEFGNLMQWQNDYKFDISIKEGVFQIHCKIKLDPQFAIPPGDFAQFKRDRKADLEAVWDRKWKEHRANCKRGKKCNCPGGCCLFEIRVMVSFVNGGEHVTVKLFEGNPDSHPVIDHYDANGQPVYKWWNCGEWWMSLCGRESSGGFVYAHEFGHNLGMWDEYPNGAVFAKYYKIRGSIMNSGSKVLEHHWTDHPTSGESIHKWFLDAVGEPYNLVKM